MNTWVIVFIGWLCFCFGCTVARNGQPRTGEHSTWSAVVWIGIEVAILYMAGFFSL